MASLNKVFLIGNLTRPPELRYTPSGAGRRAGGRVVCGGNAALGERRRPVLAGRKGGRPIPTIQKPVKRRRFGRRKVCKFCADKVDLVDYKDVRRLRTFVSERGKIIPRRISGSCARHQRQLTHAIKRARTVALLPYLATE